MLATSLNGDVERQHGTALATKLMGGVQCVLTKRLRGLHIGVLLRKTVRVIVLAEEWSCLNSSLNSAQRRLLGSGEAK